LNKSTKVMTRFVFIVVFLLLLFLLPRVFSLGNDISNSDALRWHRRAGNFLSALKEENFEQTYQRYHPGVTVMWVGATSELALSEYQQIKGEEVGTLENTGFFPRLHGLSKLFLVLVLAFTFVLQLYLIRELFGWKTAVAFGFLISLEPYFIGINRWFHLSSMEAFFSITSLLLLLLFLRKKKLYYLLLSGFFAGLGLLTKMTVFISVAFSILLIIYNIYVKRSGFKTFFVYVISVAVTFFLFFPALWVDPLSVFTSMYNAIFNAVFSDIRGEIFTLPQKIFYYPIILAFKLSPVMIFAGIYSLLKTFKEKNRDTLVIAIYFVFLILFLTLTDQKIDRYSVALFPSLILLVSVAFSKLRWVWLGVLMLLQTVTFIWATGIFYPVYSAYLNPLFGQAFVLKAGFYENSGEYYSNAAMYLNEKGRNISTHVPNNIESFKPYYKGKLTLNVEDADYVVYGLDFDRKIFPEIDRCEIEHYFGNRLYRPMAVYACKRAGI